MKKLILNLADAIEPAALFAAGIYDDADASEIVGVIVFALAVVILGVI